jgi:hypothetical protein
LDATKSSVRCSNGFLIALGQDTARDDRSTMLFRIRREARFLAKATAIGFVPVVWIAAALWNPHGDLKTLVGAIAGWGIIYPVLFVMYLLGPISVWVSAPVAILAEFFWLFLLSIPLRLIFLGGARVARYAAGYWIHRFRGE